MWIVKLTKQDWPMCCNKNFDSKQLYATLKHFITKVLKYKVGRIKFVCIAMCSLVMSLCSHDLYVTSLNDNYYNTLNSRLTVVQLTQCLVFGW